jgi:hypothetical protein
MMPLLLKQAHVFIKEILVWDWLSRPNSFWVFLRRFPNFQQGCAEDPSGYFKASRAWNIFTG